MTAIDLLITSTLGIGSLFIGYTFASVFKKTYTEPKEYTYKITSAEPPRKKRNRKPKTDQDIADKLKRILRKAGGSQRLSILNQHHLIKADTVKRIAELFPLQFEITSRKVKNGTLSYTCHLK